MAAPKSSQNKNHGKVRKLNGKVVKAVLYVGRALGHGKYFTGEVDGQLIVDEDGKPLPFKQIGELEQG